MNTTRPLDNFYRQQTGEQLHFSKEARELVAGIKERNATKLNLKRFFEDLDRQNEKEPTTNI
jgi:hypothetical protein